MKKILMVVLCVALCACVFGLTACGGIGMENYSNEVDIEEFEELLLEAVEDYGYDDEDTFEASFTGDVYMKSEKVRTYVYDSEAKIEERNVTTTNAQTKYDADNEVATISSEEITEAKSNSKTTNSRETEKAWYQKKGGNVAYSSNPDSKMYSIYEDSEVIDHVSSRSVYQQVYTAISVMLRSAYSEDDGADYEFFVDDNVFTIREMIRTENDDYERRETTFIQLIFSEGKAELKMIRTIYEITEKGEYDDYAIESVTTEEGKITLTYGEVTLNKEDLSKYNKYDY